MENGSLRDENMLKSDENAQPSGEDLNVSHPVKRFGPFLVKADDHFNLITLEKLATFAEFEEGVWDRIQKKKLPGLAFLKELVSRGRITEDSISYLTDALDFINCRGISIKIGKLFNQYCCSEVNKDVNKTNCVNFQDGERAAKMMKPNNTEVNKTTPAQGLEIFSNPFPKTTAIGRVLNMASERIVPSVKGVLVKIRLQRVSFRQHGTILRLQDARDPFLTAIVDENIESTLNLREGDIIELKHFQTKRSQKGNAKTCFLLSVPNSTIRKVADRQLEYVANQLPILECYQIGGICTYIQTIPYAACTQDDCRGRKLRNTDMNPKKKMSCPRCGTEYVLPVQTLGWYIKLVINDGSKESSEGSCIIFKSTVIQIFQKMEVSISLVQYEMQNKFKGLFDEKKVRAIVRPGSPSEIVSDLMLVQRPQRPPEDEEDVISQETLE